MRIQAVSTKVLFNNISFASKKDETSFVAYGIIRVSSPAITAYRYHDRTSYMPGKLLVDARAVQPRFRSVLGRFSRGLGAELGSGR